MRGAGASAGESVIAASDARLLEQGGKVERTLGRQWSLVHVVLGEKRKCSYARTPGALGFQRGSLDFPAHELALGALQIQLRTDKHQRRQPARVQRPGQSSELGVVKPKKGAVQGRASAAAPGEAPARRLHRL